MDQVELLPSNCTFQLPQQYLGSSQVDAIYPVSISTGKIFFRYGNKLLVYTHNEGNSTWSLTSNVSLSTRKEASYNQSEYPIKVTSNIDKEGKDVLIIRTQDGFQFYGTEAEASIATTGSALKLLATDTRFGDVYNWNEPTSTILWGKIYPNQNLMGLITRNSNGALDFYSVRKDKVLSNQQYPMGPSIRERVILTPIWTSPSTQIVILDLASSGPELIGLRTSKTKTLKFFRFNSKYQIEPVQEVSHIILVSTEGLILPANLTHNESFRNVVECSLTGIHIHTFDSATKSYQSARISLISHTDQCNTIQFFDLNQDGHMDILFTGPEGLHGISFNSVVSTWETILDNRNLKGQDCFIEILGILPSPLTVFSFDDTSRQMRLWNLVKKTLTQLTSTTTSIPSIQNNIKENNARPYSAAGSLIIPEIIDPLKLRAKFARRTLRWVEQFDEKFLKDSLEVTNGFVGINVPLLTTMTPEGMGLQLYLTYNSRSVGDPSDLLGTGWNIPLANDCIRVNFQSSIFPEDAIYTLLGAGKSEVLKRLDETSQTITFEIVNQPGVNCTYHKKGNSGFEKWVIESSKERMVYGNSAESIEQSLSWPHWKGLGREWEKLEQVSLAWFLTEHHSKEKNASLFYSYEISTELAPEGKTYVSDLRLVKITDKENTNINFGYSLKQSSEYKIPPKTNSQGYIQIGKIKKHFLENVQFQSLEYEQSFKLRYTFKNEERLLTQIDQELHGEGSENLLEFTYENTPKVTLLNSVILPRGLTLQYTFKPNPMITCPPIYPPTQRNSIPEKHTIASGPDYLVTAWKNDLEIIYLKVLNLQSVQTLLETATPKQILEMKAINSFSINAYGNLFYLTIDTETRKIVCIFSRDAARNKWNPSPKYHKADHNSFIRYSSSLLVIASNTRKNFTTVDILFSENGVQELKETLIESKPLQQFVIDPQSENRIYTYDDTELCLVSRKSVGGTWKSQSLSIVGGDGDGDGFMALIQKTMDSFDHSPNTTKILLDDMRNTLLQIQNNAISLSALAIENDILVLRVSLFLLDENFLLKNKEELSIRKDDLLKLEYKLEYGNSTLMLMYKKNANGKYTVRAKSVRGEMAKEVEKIKNKNLKADAMDQLVKDVNDNKDWKESIKDVVLFSWGSQYRTQLSPLGLNIGTSGSILRMTGTQWTFDEQNYQSREVQLGEYFILEEENKENATKGTKIYYKLYSKGSKSTGYSNAGKTLIKTIEASSPNYLVNKFPLYLAWQSGGDIRILPFLSQDTLAPEQIFPQEEILYQSTYQNLFSIANATSSNLNHVATMELVSRPIWSFMPKIMEDLVHKVDLLAHGTTRQTSYERSFQFSRREFDDVCTDTVEIIPGGDRTISGWRSITTEHHFLGQGNTKTIKRKEAWFDADNHIVQKPIENKDEKSVEKAPSSTDEEENNLLLKDKSGRLLICNFSPYNGKDGEIGYFGFELYEKIGKKFGWIFNETNIVRNGFSLTGNSFLRLQNLDDFQREFEPTNQSQEVTYIVSAWLRLTSKSYSEQAQAHHQNIKNNLNESLPFFKALVSTTTTTDTDSTKEELVGLQGIVTKQDGDWNYVEILIDLKMLRHLYKKKQESIGKTGTAFTMGKFSITIYAGLYEGTNAFLDIDHVRFSPLDHDFQASVYNSDSLSGKPRPSETIASNGEISRIIYNRFDQGRSELIRYKSNGTLGPLIRENKAGYLFPSPQITIRSQDQNFTIPSQTQLPSILTFVPHTGFYEKFDSFAFKERWNMTINEKNEEENQQEKSNPWKSSPGRLYHDSEDTHQIQANSGLFHPKSTSLRCFLQLQSGGAFIRMIWNRFSLLFATIDNKNGTLSLNFESPTTGTETLFNVRALPLNGEFIISVETSVIFIWLNGVLLLEQELPFNSNFSETNPWSFFAFEAKGSTLIEDCIFMNLPKITVEFLNSFGDTSQVIHLEGSKSVFVSENLYDILGRGGIRTKQTRLFRNYAQNHNQEQQPLLAYHASFALNVNPSNETSVWKTGILHGDVNALNSDDEGYPYYRTTYYPNPLNEEEASGYPGKDFSIGGRYAKKLGSKNSGIPFLTNYFPSSLGFWQKTERFPNGKITVDVFNAKKSKVASYIHSPGYDHILSTFEYDDENRLVKILPPNYHEMASTLSKSESPLWQSNTNETENHLSMDEKNWQVLMGTHFTYNSEGLIASKSTPDAGKVTFVYNSLKQIQYTVYEEANSIHGNHGDDVRKHNKTITNFFEYDKKGRLSRTGYFQTPFNAFNPNLTESQRERLYKIFDFEHQQIFYSNDDPQYDRRGRFKQFFTRNDNAIENNEDNNDEDADKDNNAQLVEELEFNSEEQLVSKQTLTLPGVIDSETISVSSIKKEYHGGRLYSLQYPVSITPADVDSNSNGDGELFKLTYHYNRQGQLISIGTPRKPSLYSLLIYNVNGLISTEIHSPHSVHKFTKNFSYNSPGFLEIIEDKFLKQTLSYSKEGYGQDGYGDGSVMKSSFLPKWSAKADWRSLKIDEISKKCKFELPKICKNALQRLGFLSPRGRILKEFNIALVKIDFPLQCGGKIAEKISQILSSKQTPQQMYGHRYGYGNHGELVKAKYFAHDESEAIIKNPLQFNSFTSIPGVNKSMSEDIWNKLTQAGHILTNTRNFQTKEATGKLVGGEPLFERKELEQLLKGLKSEYFIYERVISEFLLNKFIQRMPFNAEEFYHAFLVWDGLIDSVLSVHPLETLLKTNIAKDILAMLSTNGYTTIVQNSQNSETQYTQYTVNANKNAITALLENYSDMLPEILGVLQDHFAQELGTHPYDLESYEIDPNGNHKKFYTGFHRFEMSYRNKTNQIRSISLNSPEEDSLEKSYDFQHDLRGNVIRSMHQGIKRIVYNHNSQRTTRIELLDGKLIKFFYDSQGERILKQVFTREGLVLKEIFYVRDEKGRVLMDTESSFDPSRKSSESLRIQTLYIYGPRGIIGFYRNGNFYSVITDHSGSTRLVVKDGQVLVAYDYMPYGQLMRSYVANTSKDHDHAHIRYRFTGKEWDEETGLYNFHARFYDPLIGRFYQVDPKAQYFSPYKYAGNSPISLVDPDWEEAVTIALCIVLGIVGGYLGGASANNRLNFLKWDYKDHGTYLGIGGGVLTGALLPIGFGASVATIGTKATIALGLGSSYLTAAGANGKWDFTKWAWDSPSTYNALFQGFGTGSGLVGGIKAPISLLKKVFEQSRTGQVIFISLSFVSGTGVMYTKASLSNKGKVLFWEWDWTDPNTYSSLIDGFDSGFGWPQGFVELGRGLGKIGKEPSRIIKAVSEFNKDGTKLGGVVRFFKHPVTKTFGGGLGAYYMASANNQNFVEWNWSSFGTYEGILNGVFLGKDVSSMLQYSKDAKLAKQMKKLAESESFSSSSSSTTRRRWRDVFQNVANIFYISRKKAAMEQAIRRARSSDQNSLIYTRLPEESGSKAVVAENGEGEKSAKLVIDIDDMDAPKHKDLDDDDDAIRLKIEIDLESNGDLMDAWKEDTFRSKDDEWEIHPDRELEFVGCGGRGLGRRRRKKRHMTNNDKCSVSTKTNNKDKVDDDANLKPGEKPELGQLLIGRNDDIVGNFKKDSEGFYRLPDEITPKSSRVISLFKSLRLQKKNTAQAQTPAQSSSSISSSTTTTTLQKSSHNLAEKFQNLLQNTPKQRDTGESKVKFFTNMFLGSILTLPFTSPSNLQIKQILVMKAEPTSIPLRDKFDSLRGENSKVEIQITKIVMVIDDGTTTTPQILIRTMANAGQWKGKNLHASEISEIRQKLRDDLAQNSKLSKSEWEDIKDQLPKGIKEKNPTVEGMSFFIEADGHSLSLKEIPITPAEKQNLLEPKEAAKVAKKTEETKEKKLTKETEETNPNLPPKTKIFTEVIKADGNTFTLKDSNNNGITINLKDSMDGIVNPSQSTVDDPSPIASSSSKNVEETANYGLTNDPLQPVVKSIEKLSQDLLEIYKLIPTTGTIKETEFHGFFYGALAYSFKYSYALDIAVERIAGRGYADVLFVSRKDPHSNKIDKSWYGTPIIIELKADKSSSTNALDQSEGTGYLYNLSLRTLAKKAILVGINSAKTKTTEAVKAKLVDIPQPEIFARHAISPESDEGSIKQQLQHLYFSFNPMARKTDRAKNDHYFSRLILGQYLSSECDQIYVNHHTKGNGNKDGSFTTTTILVKAKSENINNNNNGEWTMLNIVESSEWKGTEKNGHYVFKDVGLPESLIPPGLSNEIKSLNRIDIQVNSRSKHGWSTELPKRTADVPKGKNEKKKKVDVDVEDPKVFLQEFSQNQESGTFKESADYKKLTLVKSDFFSEATSIHQQPALTELKSSINPIKDTISSESYFQAVAQGLLMGQQPPGYVVKVFPELNPSVSGRIDLAATRFKMEGDVPTKQEVVIMELKYDGKTKNSGENINSEKSLRKPLEQIEKYELNLKALTDAKTYKKIVATWYQHEGTIIQSVGSGDIAHSSDVSRATSARETPSTSRRNSFFDIYKNPEINSDLQLAQQIVGERREASTSKNKRPFDGGEEENFESRIKYTESGDKGRYRYKRNAKLQIERNDNGNRTSTGSSILELGDELMSRMDVQGNLLWMELFGHIFRKFKTGHYFQKTRHTSMSMSMPFSKSLSRIELDIEAGNIRDEFAKAVRQCSKVVGIPQNSVERIVEILYLESGITTIIRSHLENGNVEDIPISWLRLMGRIKGRLNTVCAPLEVEKLLEEMKTRISEWQKNLVGQETNILGKVG